MAYALGSTEERHVKTQPGRCGAAISNYRILMKDTDGDEFITATGGTVTPLGVSGNASENTTKVTYEENDPIAVKYAGIVFLTMGSAGNRGDRVMCNASGSGIRHVNTDGVWIVGVATQDWVDGDVIPVQWIPFFMGDFTLS